MLSFGIIAESNSNNSNITDLLFTQRSNKSNNSNKIPIQSHGKGEKRGRKWTRKTDDCRYNQTSNYQMCIWFYQAMRSHTNKISKVLPRLKKQDYATTVYSNGSQDKTIKNNWLLILGVSLCMAWRLVLWSWKQTNV